ncbi:WhiB family transcriptional regulator [Microbacterium sp.]|uniref:WhiB family transcriptional regulator n=1 Tax=Microbacterium sp. TaxID=51671 RepID=UPI0037364F83
MSRGDAEYLALHAALNETTPPCSNDPRFILDANAYAPGEAAELKRTVCNPCPLLRLCRAYAEAARPEAGVWAGRTYPSTKRRRQH